jgi:hypothetical protein
MTGGTMPPRKSPPSGRSPRSLGSRSPSQDAADTMLHLVTKLTTRRLAAAGRSGEPRSELLLRGQPTHRVVDGAVLEAAVGWGDDYVVFTTDDIPYEESLHISLLDRALHLQDTATISAPYGTGAFAALALVPPSTVRFRFLGEQSWQLDVFDRPRLCWPAAGSHGVRRRFTWWQRFALRVASEPAG